MGPLGSTEVRMRSNTNGRRSGTLPRREAETRGHRAGAGRRDRARQFFPVQGQPRIQRGKGKLPAGDSPPALGHRLCSGGPICLPARIRSKCNDGNRHGQTRRRVLSARRTVRLQSPRLVRSTVLRVRAKALQRPRYGEQGPNTPRSVKSHTSPFRQRVTATTDCSSYSKRKQARLERGSSTILTSVLRNREGVSGFM